MGKLVLITAMVASIISCNAQEGMEKSLSKNGMSIAWKYRESQIDFTVSAPTRGWVTIGFNNTSDIVGAYLIMGNVIDGLPNVVEHYTLSPGNYRAINSLGEKPKVSNIAGSQYSNTTTMSFSLPTKALNKYQKDLTEGTTHTMIIAYSQEDDFQHHSSMRTSINIQL